MYKNENLVMSEKKKKNYARVIYAMPATWSV